MGKNFHARLVTSGSRRRWMLARQIISNRNVSLVSPLGTTRFFRMLRDMGATAMTECDEDGAGIQHRLRHVSST